MSPVCWATRLHLIYSKSSRRSYGSFFSKRLADPDIRRVIGWDGHLDQSHAWHLGQSLASPIHTVRDRPIQVSLHIYRGNFLLHYTCCHRECDTVDSNLTPLWYSTCASNQFYFPWSNTIGLCWNFAKIYPSVSKKIACVEFDPWSFRFWWILRLGTKTGYVENKTKWNAFVTLRSSRPQVMIRHFE